MYSKRKKLYVGLGLFLGALVVFVIVIAVSVNRYNDKLLKEGIRVKAQVLNLSQQKSRKGKIKQCFVDLALFEKGEQINSEIEKARGSSIDDKLDALFDEYGSQNFALGEYQTVQTTTSSEHYNDLYVGKTVVFVYLKDEVDEGKLLIDLN